MLKEEKEIKVLTNLLEKSYSTVIDFDQPTEHIVETYNNYCVIKEKIIENSFFGAYINDPEYCRVFLICEALGIFLREIAPHRKRKHNKRKKSLK